MSTFGFESLLSSSVHLARGRRTVELSTEMSQRALKAASVTVILAVKNQKFGGDGWESNHPRTPQQRPANGFEDRGTAMYRRLETSAAVRSRAFRFQDCPRLSAGVR
jgi:hypothetical protein